MEEFNTMIYHAFWLVEDHVGGYQGQHQGILGVSDEIQCWEDLPPLRLEATAYGNHLD